MKSNRLFVGNLPPNITDDELIREFGSYGKVTSVDIKTKANAINNDKTNKFAFVNIEIDDYMVKQCIQEFRETAYRGFYITVSVAKESFLDKLKREREETAAIEENKKLKLSKKVEEEPESEEFVIKQSKFKVPETEVEDGDLLIKKRNQGAFRDNGKLKILGGTGNPIYTFNKKDNQKAEKDPHAKQSDQKRLESINKKKELYDRQKLAIKSALTERQSNNKKIVFDDSEGFQTKSNKRKSLFDGDEAEDDFANDFSVKKQFEGKQGQKLLELKTKFRNDDRFQMDEDFQEREEGEDEAPELYDDSERQKQLEILGKVVGKTYENQSQKKVFQNTMLRFDPSKESHKKFIKQKPELTKDEPEDEEDESNQIEEPIVSSEKFYKVSDRIGEALKGEQQGFSLLGMHGRHDDEGEFEENGNAYYDAQTIIKSKSTYNDNPFKYDSSDDEEKPKKTKEIKPTKEKLQKVGGKTNKRGIFNENFFILTGDVRLQEGLSFFSSSGKTDNRDFGEVRRELKKIVSRKIRKNLQKHNQFSKNHRKPNKRFVKQGK